jgi:hypothetical protein
LHPFLHPFLQALQEIIDTGELHRGVPFLPIPARVYLGGDLPWLKRMLGISTCAQVASLYNEGVKQKGDDAYTGCEVTRTTASDAAHKADYDRGSESLQVAGCIGHPVLRLPDRRMAVVCVLHTTMALGRLLCAFINTYKPRKGPGLDELQVVLDQHKTGFTVGSESGPDGEDTARLLRAWDAIRPLLPEVTDAQDAAVRGVSTMLRTLYKNEQEAKPAPHLCRDAMRKFAAHCMEPGQGGHYVNMLLHDMDDLLAFIHPVGLAMFSGDVVESMNRILKRAYSDHSNRAGGRMKAHGFAAPDSVRRQKDVDAHASVLAQCLQWVFLYFHIHLVCQGKVRATPCNVAQNFEKWEEVDPITLDPPSHTPPLDPPSPALPLDPPSHTGPTRPTRTTTTPYTPYSSNNRTITPHYRNVRPQPAHCPAPGVCRAGIRQGLGLHLSQNWG